MFSLFLLCKYFKKFSYKYLQRKKNTDISYKITEILLFINNLYCIKNTVYSLIYESLSVFKYKCNDIYYYVDQDVSIYK